MPPTIQNNPKEALAPDTDPSTDLRKVAADTQQDYSKFLAAIAPEPGIDPYRFIDSNPIKSLNPGAATKPAPESSTPKAAPDQVNSTPIPEERAQPSIEVTLMPAPPSMEEIGEWMKERADREIDPKFSRPHHGHPSLEPAALNSGRQPDPASAHEKKMDKNDLEFRAAEIHAAMDGLGTDEKRLIKAFDGLSVQDLAGLRDAYERKFGGKMMEDIRGDLSTSEFIDLMKKIIEPPTEVENAAQLYYNITAWTSDSTRKMYTGFLLMLYKGERLESMLKTFELMYSDQFSSWENALQSQMSKNHADGLIAEIKDRLM